MKDSEIKERLDFIEFRQDLLFNNTELDRLLYEYSITRNEYEQIMDLMDLYRNKIAHNEKVSHLSFENEMSQILSNHTNIDYHFSEYITIDFMNEGRWNEVYPALYGSRDIVFI